MIDTHAYWGETQPAVVVVAGADVVVVEELLVVEVDSVVPVVLAVLVVPTFVVLLDEPPPDEPRTTSTACCGGRGGLCLLTTGPGHGRSQAAAFDVNTREEQVLVRVGIAITRQFQYAQVPISAVARRRDGHGFHRQLQIVGAGRVPESDGVRAEVDLIGYVVPHIGGKLDFPLRLTVGHPAEIGIRCATGAAEPADFHLGEVALEEVDLVLSGRGGRVCVAAQHAEVVPDLPRVDGRGRLWNQFRASHRLPVPIRRRIQRDLDTLG